MTGSKNNSPQTTTHHPTITDMISLELPSQVKVSPGGRRVAYVVRTTNWNKNCYENLCYVHDVDRKRSFQLTQSGNVVQIEWISDDSLAVAKSEKDKKAQIYVFEHLIGEGIQITDHKNGVQFFKPFAEGVLFIANNPEREEKKPRAEEFGTFTHFEREDSASALYYASFERVRAYHQESKQLPEDKAGELVKPILELSRGLDQPLKIVNFVVSPLNDAIYLNCRSRDDLVYWEATSTYRLRLDPEESLEVFIDRERDKQDKPKRAQEQDTPEEEEDLSYLGELSPIALPEAASIAAVSPDGSKLLIRHKARDNMFYTQSDLWILDLTETEDVLEDDQLIEHMKNISGDLDREIMHVQWPDSGIFVSYVSGTQTDMAQLTESGAVHRLDLECDSARISPLYQFHVSKEGALGFTGANEKAFPEVFIASQAPTSSWAVQQLTAFGKKTVDWDLGTVETIHWFSKDGTEIEGALRKPSSFDPDKKYPLVFVVHGGPRWHSPAFLLDFDDLAYYPSVQFAHGELLVLKPNYRGSLGRGQAFAELNKNNLGIGDLEDLESAIEHLDAQGIIDASRVGCMGWSQGGYISAFVGTHSDKFRAVSVGAGIADWYTYHVTNDIPDFTAHYLSGSPFQNRELYVKTAPMSKIQEAKTPTLIQHGAQDRRVPLANATELYRGLKDAGVQVELFVYPEMAHPITKPRENRAVMWQNFTWFCHHLLGGELDFFKSAPEEKGDA